MKDKSGKLCESAEKQEFCSTKRYLSVQSGIRPNCTMDDKVILSVSDL